MQFDLNISTEQYTLLTNCLSFLFYCLCFHVCVCTYLPTCFVLLLCFFVAGVFTLPESYQGAQDLPVFGFSELE